MKNRVYHLIIISLLPTILISCNHLSNKNSSQESAKIKTVDTNITGQLSSEDNNIISYDSIVPNTNTHSGATTYSLDYDSSRIIWNCVIHTGYTKFSSGEIQLFKDSIVDGHFKICMDSITDTDIDYQLMNSVLVNTLKSKDFFDITKFPYAYFDLVRVKEIPGGQYEIVGNLTIKNVTNQIRFQSDIQNQDSIILARSNRFSIDRTKWGITLYSRNFEQTDDRFLFTDMVNIEIILRLKKGV